MNKKNIIYWIGSIVFTILSVLMVVFLSQNAAFSVIMLTYMVLPAGMLIGVDCGIKPHEWLMYSVALFATSVMMVYEVNVLWYSVPILTVFLLMIVVRIFKKEKIGRILLAIVVQILCSILILGMATMYSYAKIMENKPYKQEIVKQVDNSSVVFESSNTTYYLSPEKASLIKQGDTVYVKVYENSINEIKR